MSIFSNGGHLGWRAWLSDITFKGNSLRMIQAKFGLNWPSGFRGEDFWKSLQMDDRRQVMAIAHTGELKMNGSNNSFICWYLLVLSWIKCYIISNECLFICVDFRCVANHMQMWLGKQMVISHFGYWHFLSTVNTEIFSY